MGLDLEGLIDNIVKNARTIDSDFPPLDVWDRIKRDKQAIQDYINKLEAENRALRVILGAE